MSTLFLVTSKTSLNWRRNVNNRWAILQKVFREESFSFSYGVNFSVITFISYLSNTQSLAIKAGKVQSLDCKIKNQTNKKPPTHTTHASPRVKQKILIIVKKFKTPSFSTASILLELFVLTVDSIRNILFFSSLGFKNCIIKVGGKYLKW